MPDLDVQNTGDSYPPTLSDSSVTAGQSVTLTYRLSNWGPDGAPSSTTGIYRSTNSTISTSDTRVGADANASLSANTGRTETFTIDTTGWAAGAYYIGAVADYADNVSEVDESNNASSGVWLTVTSPVQLPDLDVQNTGDSYPPTLSDSSVTAGQSVTLTYRLSNWGPGGAPSSTTGIYRSTNSTISTSDTRVGADANASLSANTGRTESFTIDTTGWATGTYYIGAVADYSDDISEADEDNNASSGIWLTVTAPVQLPDLDVRNAGDSYPPTLSASSVTAGQSVTLTYRLSNWGPGGAPSSTTGIYRSTDSTITTGDTRVGADANASLSANTGRTETFTIDTTGWAAGTYYIGAVADYANNISEADESNNPSSGIRLIVTAPVQLPDLDVRNAGDSYPPTLSASSVTAGQSVTLTYRLSNWGPGGAPSSTTGIYRSTDNTISTSDTRVGADANASLSASSGRTETFTINTSGWAAGTYYIGAVADYANNISEANESNNPSSGIRLTVTEPTTDTIWTKPIALTQSPLGGVTLSVNQGYMGATSHHSNHGQHSIDLQAAIGTDVLSVVTGTIVRYGGSDAASTGIYLTIRGDSGLYISYFHLQKALITSGRVTVGQHIAESGDTGGVPPHLHIQFGDRLSDSGNVAWSSSTTNGVPAAFMASFFSGPNSSETAGLVNVLNRSEIRSTDIFGTGAARLIDGTRDDDRMSGSALGERIFGGGGHDVLNGLGGNDTIVGGSGNDTLTGGANIDTFVFGTALGLGNIDTVTDFSVVDDRIWLSNAIFTAAGPLGQLSAAAFRVGTAAADASDRIIYNPSTGALIYDSNGNAAGGAVRFATLDPGLALTSADFIVI